MTFLEFMWEVLWTTLAACAIILAAAAAGIYLSSILLKLTY